MWKQHKWRWTFDHFSDREHQTVHESTLVECRRQRTTVPQTVTLVTCDDSVIRYDPHSHALCTTPHEISTQCFQHMTGNKAHRKIN